MTLTATIKGKIKIPKLDFTETLLEVAKSDITTRITKNIDKGIDLQEKKYDSLDDKTISAKGGDSRPLIDTGRLRIAWQIIRRGKNEVLIRIKAGRRKIGKFLQEDGIKTRRGKRFFNFFGISTRAERAGIKRMENEIKKRVANAGR